MQYCLCTVLNDHNSYFNCSDSYDVQWACVILHVYLDIGCLVGVSSMDVVYNIDQVPMINADIKELDPWVIFNYYKIAWLKMSFF